jgi:hypothetical protein
MGETKEKDCRVSNEEKKDEEAIETVEEYRKVSQGKCKQVNVFFSEIIPLYIQKRKERPAIHILVVFGKL